MAESKESALARQQIQHALAYAAYVLSNKPTDNLTDYLDVAEHFAELLLEPFSPDELAQLNPLLRDLKKFATLKELETSLCELGEVLHSLFASRYAIYKEQERERERKAIRDEKTRSV